MVVKVHPKRQSEQHRLSAGLGTEEEAFGASLEPSPGHHHIVVDKEVISIKPLALEGSHALFIKGTHIVKAMNFITGSIKNLEGLVF